MTDPPFMRKIEFMKKTMGLTYILEHAYKRGGEAEAETETERKGMKGEKKERRRRGEREEEKEKDGLVKLTGFYVLEGCVM